MSQLFASGSDHRHYYRHSACAQEKLDLRRGLLFDFVGSTETGSYQAMLRATRHGCGGESVLYVFQARV